jgi:hypothetical protein
MKIIQSVLVALAIMFATIVPAQADTAYKTFTQDEGIAALEAGDAAGYKVIPRKELEEVRGESLPAAVVIALATISYYGLVYGVPFALNYAASLSNGSVLVKDRIKQEVKKYFGW